MRTRLLPFLVVAFAVLGTTAAGAQEPAASAPSDRKSVV
jgi:hypothetical protein